LPSTEMLNQSGF